MPEPTDDSSASSTDAAPADPIDPVPPEPIVELLFRLADDMAEQGFDDTLDPKCIPESSVRLLNEIVALALPEMADQVGGKRALVLPGGLEALRVARIVQAFRKDSLERDDIQEIVGFGQQLRSLGQFASERRILSFLHDRLPGAYWPWFGLGRLSLEEGDHSRAAELLQRAVQLDPSHGWSNYLCGKALAKIGRHDEAAACFGRAATLLPEAVADVALNRLLTLPRHEWTRDHSDCLRLALAAPHLSEDAIGSIVALTAEYVSNRAWFPDRTGLFADALLSLVEDRDSLITREFRLIPMLFVASLGEFFVDPAKASQLLCAFESKLPEKLDTSTLPHYFKQHISAAVDTFIRNLYLRTVDWTPAHQAYCLMFAEIEFHTFGNAGLTRLVTDILHAGCVTALSQREMVLRVLAYSFEKKWFELVGLLRSPGGRALLRSNSEIFLHYSEAVLKVSEGWPNLTLMSVQNLLEMARRFDNSAELGDALSGPLTDALRSTAQLLYSRQKTYARDRNRSAGIALWEVGLRWSCDLAEAVETLAFRGDPAPQPVDPRSVLILTSPYLQQVLQYRGYQLAELFHADGMDATLVDLTVTPISSLHLRALCAKLVVVQRQPATTDVVQFLAWCRKMGIRTLYDIDDQIFDSSISPLPIEDYSGRISAETHLHLQFDCAYFLEAMQRCDEIMASTQPLVDQIAAVLRSEKPIYLRRNMIGTDLRVVRAETAARDWAEAPAEKAVEIFYGSGTKAHKQYFDTVVFPALITVARRRDAARVTLIGDFGDLRVPFDLADRFIVEDTLLDYKSYLKRLARADISIAPININPVTDTKSELKWFEAAALDVCSVVSPTANYRDVLTEGQHALFADTPAQWVDALERLIDQPQLRRDLVEASRRLISSDYEISVMANPLVNALGLGNPAGTRKQRRRLLVVNTFFAPQSVGGATRIAETYVRDLVHRFADRYDVFVLTSDLLNRSDPAYRLSIHANEGATVIRCGVPARDWADASDSKIEELVADLARKIGIDVAHLHSIQVLTGSVATGLRRAGVPVVVTLHDGWWLSEHQFLVDDTATPFTPRADAREIAETTTHRLSRTQRGERREELAWVLKGCSRILAVSEAFAEVYRGAGLPRVEVHENGVDLDVTAVERAERPAGAPLRIGFIGGMSAHKGLRLLESAVRSADLPNIELVIVDHRWSEGYERETIWGTSRVRLVGKFAQSRVGDLYAMFDILAAPSIWPESFGLVAREARAHGVPVIVGNRGDIARDVEPGRDGWVVDVSSDNDLRELLVKLNAAPSEGALRPELPKVVSIQEAVDKLVAIIDAL